MSILCTGGAGYIGSHTTIALIDAGFDVIIADNFSNSSKKILGRLEKIIGRRVPCIEVDFTDASASDKVFEENKIVGVVHFAALKDLNESIAFPLRYYQNNMLSLINILKSMEKYNCTNFVFSSSAAVYKECPDKLVNEEDPTGPENPYGQTKHIAERICQDVAKANKSLRITLLRYFNPVGNHPSGLIGESPELPPNVLPYIQQVAVGRRPQLVIFGNDWNTKDGTGVRDFIHVSDLAEGHVAALRHLILKQEQEEGGCFVYNLGTGTGTSVLELVNFFSEESGRPVPFRIGDRRPGDLGSVVADASKANEELKWATKRTIREACKDAWSWQSKHPLGWADVEEDQGGVQREEKEEEEKAAKGCCF